MRTCLNKRGFLGWKAEKIFLFELCKFFSRLLKNQTKMRWSNISVEYFFIIYYCLYFSCFECLCAGPFYYFFPLSLQSVKGTMRQKCSLPLRSENGTFFKKLAFSLHFFSDFLTSLPKCVLQFFSFFLFHYVFRSFVPVLFYIARSAELSTHVLYGTFPI